VEEDRIMKPARLDPLALTAALLAFGMAIAYVWTMYQQGDTPVAWFLALLVLGAALAGYGSRLTTTRRRAALLVASPLLAALGLVSIFSFGAPILVAGALCLLAAVRTQRSAVT
jgi:hypothetical protein